MSSSDDRPLFQFSLTALLVWIVFVTYLLVALIKPSHLLTMPIVMLLVLLLGSSVVVAVCSKGAKRIYWAAFASFGFAQCFVLGIHTMLDRRASGYFHRQTLEEWYLRIYQKPFADDFDAMKSIIYLTSIIVISAIAASICRAVYVTSSRHNERQTEKST